jgi:pimeloyl-ACP methyl ester carboxylesterase
LIYFARNGQRAQGGNDVSRTRYARGDGLRVAHELRGKLHWRRPWLVLIQGMGLDRSGWGPVLRRLRRHFRLVLVDNRGSGRSGLPRIRARTLVLQGAADTVVDPRNAKLLAGRIPGAQLVIFPELGHLLFWQEPDSFADVVTLFLLHGAKINKSAPAAVPGTTDLGRPVGAAPPP